jgi:hypothetical protein
LIDAQCRIAALLVQERVAPEHWSNQVFCGPFSFLIDLQGGLEGDQTAKNMFH